MVEAFSSTLVPLCTSEPPSLRRLAKGLYVRRNSTRVRYWPGECSTRIVYSAMMVVALAPASAPPAVAVDVVVELVVVVVVVE